MKNITLSADESLIAGGTSARRGRANDPQRPVSAVACGLCWAQTTSGNRHLHHPRPAWAYIYRRAQVHAGRNE